MHLRVAWRMRDLPWSLHVFSPSCEADRVFLGFAFYILNRYMYNIYCLNGAKREPSVACSALQSPSRESPVWLAQPYRAQVEGVQCGLLSLTEPQ